MAKKLPVMQEMWGSIPGLGRLSGEGNGNPLQYSCLGNPMDRGAGRLQFMGSQRVRHDLVTKHIHTEGERVTNPLPELSSQTSGSLTKPSENAGSYFHPADFWESEAKQKVIFEMFRGSTY